MTVTARRPQQGIVLTLIRKAIRFEVGMWRSLFRWALRRPRVPAGAEAFGYAGAVTPILWAFIILSAIEIPVAHLLLPWETARIIMLALGAWGLIWMAGLLASMHVYPHAINDDGLRIRNGISVDFTIPWDAVATIGSRTRSPESSRTVQLDDSGPGLILSIATSGQTNVDITLREPMRIPLPKGISEPVTELRVYADQPTALITRARQNLPRGASHRNRECYGHKDQLVKAGDAIPRHEALPDVFITPISGRGIPCRLCAVTPSVLSRCQASSGPTQQWSTCLLGGTLASYSG